MAKELPFFIRDNFLTEAEDCFLLRPEYYDRGTPYHLHQGLGG